MNSKNQTESRRSSLVSICGEDSSQPDGGTQDPNVFTLDLNELSGGDKMDSPSKIRINASALRDL